MNWLIGVVCTLGFVAPGACVNNVALVRTEPDPHKLPCPQERIKFQCQIHVFSYILAWTLPNGDLLEFAGSSNIGDSVNSSDNIFTATLTNKKDDPSNRLRFIFTSTLAIFQPTNGSNLTCIGGSAGDPVDQTTTIILSGPPDPPSDLGYNSAEVIETSVDLQWTRPSYTGGVSVRSYRVSVNGRTETVEDNKGRVQYSPGLVHGEIMVSVINTCGQESQPGAIHIPAKAPPEPILNFAFLCRDILSPWTIEWMNELKEGVVYSNITFILELTDPHGYIVKTFTSGHPACSNMTHKGTNCTVNLLRDRYNITLTLMNDFGSAVESEVFDTRAIIVENVTLEDGEPLSVILTVNSECPEKCPIAVMFGTESEAGGSCDIQQNVIKGSFAPGETTTFSVDARSFIRLSGERYCYSTSLCGSINQYHCDIEESHSLSTTETVAITAVVCVVCSFTAGMLFCGLLTGCRGCCQKKGKRDQQVIYEDIPLEKRTTIELQNNEAYGHIS